MPENQENFKLQFTSTSQRKTSQQKSSWQYVGYLGDVGFSVSLPIIGGALLGNYADRVWSSYPRATLAFIFVGIFISIVNFVRIIKEIIKK